MKERELESLGIPREYAGLFQKVRDVLGKSSYEDYANNPRMVYRACEESGKFDDSELKVLAGAYGKGSSFFELLAEFLRKVFNK